MAPLLTAAELARTYYRRGLPERQCAAVAELERGMVQ